ncbi:ABC transporter permease [Paenibacillus albiflavus]|uniref:ABC transporter permease n=1 Tax=Paenibacillus albiflavus TaxID=2545760 RepID=A0A4R4EHW9_9BACL|nr:ABC transporter permease [Paenibacillus albiflavus]TCZ77775.1 ABC transporter permease [Paenibacillus albiflavus]
MSNKHWFHKTWPPIVTAIVLLALWQVSVDVFQIKKFILPSPLAIAQEAIASYDKFSVHAFATIKLNLIGFVVGSMVGLILAFLLHMSDTVKAAVYPLLLLSQNIPTIVLAPLFMMWFGFGLLPKLMVITLVCFFPIAVSMLDGFAQTDRVMLNYMKMIGATRRQIFFKLELPSALPHLFSGLKIAATYSVMGAIIAEWLAGSDKGVGMYMLLQKSAFRIDRVFVAIGLIVIMSMLLFGIIVMLEKWLIRWKPKR